MPARPCKYGQGMPTVEKGWAHSAQAYSLRTGPCLYGQKIVSVATFYPLVVMKNITDLVTYHRYCNSLPADVVVADTENALGRSRE